MTIFIIATLGYMLGSIKVFGLNFGTSGVILVALIFGHFGFEAPAIVKDLGLALFVGSVGLIAGPIFFAGFKKQALAYMVISVVIVGTGALATFLSTKFLNIPPVLGLGIMCGAMTSTPGLGAAIDATGSNLASVGYGVAYPFGVVGAVLFVQLVPIIGKYNIDDENRKLNEKYANHKADNTNKKPLKNLSGSDFMFFSLSMVFGFILGGISLPLPGGSSFSLGTAGGPLLSGLIFGHFGRIGNISTTIPKSTLETFRELGLMLFLLGAGTGAGNGFISIVSEYGIKLFIMGIVITLSSVSSGFFVANNIFKLSLFDSLGGVCGGNTSTPSLGALLNVAKNDNVVAPYAAAYPLSLICIVLVCQFMALVLK